MSEPKYKVTNRTTGEDTLFSDTANKTALQHAEDHINLNQGLFEMTVYFRSSKPAPHPAWEFMRFIPENTPKAAVVE